MSALLLLVVVGALTYYLLNHYFGKDKTYYEKLGRVPGRPTLPIIGNAHQISSNPRERFLDLIRNWKDFNYGTYKFKMGPEINVIMSTAENIEVIVKQNTQIDKPMEYGFFRRWIGDGLLLSTGAKWKRQRKIITPTFHFKILDEFVKVFNEHSIKLVNILEKKKGTLVNFHEYALYFSLDCICETAIGAKINVLETGESDFVKAVQVISELANGRTYSALKRVQWIYDLSPSGRKERECLKVIHGLSNKLFRERKEAMKDEIAAALSSGNTDDLLQLVDKQKNKTRPFLDLLLLSKLPDGQLLDDQTIKDEVDTFIFEGYDTTSSGVMFSLYVLSKHPEVQQRVFEEQVAILGTDQSVNPTQANLNEMTYLERAIKEALRIYPPVPLIARHLTEDTDFPDGTEIPANTTIRIFIYGLHRDPKYYDDPEKYDPDRFLDGKLKNNPFAFLPFSAGQRNCIGQKFAMLEIKAVVSRMIRRYELLDAGPEHEVKVIGEMTLKPYDGLYFKFVDRKY